MKHYKLLSLITVLCLISISTTLAQKNQDLDVPRTISYQGLLTSTDGTPLPNGSYQITVTLYGDEAGTRPLWTDSYTTTTFGGVFNLYLGSNKPLPTSNEMNRPLWVGTAVDQTDEMRPLTPLSSSPYALNLPDRAITTKKLAEGAVTAEKVDMEYISGVSINGQKISGKGTVLDIRSSDDIALEYDEVSNTLNIRGQDQQGVIDSEKDGASVLASPLAWDSQGDLTTGNTGGGGQAPAIGDWIGTTGIGSNREFDFIIKVHDEQIMKYQHRTDVNTPNIVGGDVTNSVATAAIGSVIAGGGSNLGSQTIGEVDYGTISGGYENTINDNADYTVISGGYTHTIQGNSHYATVGGGNSNSIMESSTSSTIGGGNQNTINSSVYAGTIGGGDDNEIATLADDGTISGGASNSIGSSSTYATIAGGQDNQILTFAKHTAIGGGQNNTIANSSPHSVIAGGKENRVGTTNDNASFSAVSGGESNFVYSNYSTIAGGQYNKVEDGNPYAFVGGGLQNTIYASTDPSVLASIIAGGQYNKVDPDAGASSIGGGTGNKVVPNAGISNPNFLHATIPGGDNLIAQSWAQTVLGGFNVAKGNVSSRKVFGGNLNSPILIIGTGTEDALRSNAFEISYNGHSTVYDRNGSGGVRPAIEGSTYTDNVVYAWATANPRAGNQNIGAPIPVTCNFGVSTIVRNAPGHYTVTMNLVHSDDNETYPAMNLDCGSVTATLLYDNLWMPEPECGVIITTPITGNTFDVYIRDLTCEPVQIPFTFKVTGRPEDSQ